MAIKNRVANGLLLVSIALAIALTTTIFVLKKQQVGNSEYLEETDSETYSVCDENAIAQYYQTGLGYRGGARAVKKKLLDKVAHLRFDQDGWVTLRFVVNCRGEIGRIRAKSVSKDQKPIQHAPSNLVALKSTVKALNPRGWTWKEKRRDSYYVLRYKIENLQISDIF